MTITALELADTDIIAAQTPSGLLLVTAISVLLPVLVDIVTRRMTTGGVKSSVLLLLSLVTGVVLEWLHAENAGLSFDFVTAGTTALLTFIISVVSFFGLTQPLKIVGANGAVQKALPGGLGGFDPDKEITPSNTVITKAV